METEVIYISSESCTSDIIDDTKNINLDNEKHIIMNSKSNLKADNPSFKTYLKDITQRDKRFNDIIGYFSQIHNNNKTSNYSNGQKDDMSNIKPKIHKISKQKFEDYNQIKDDISIEKNKIKKEKIFVDKKKKSQQYDDDNYNLSHNSYQKSNYKKKKFMEDNSFIDTYEKQYPIINSVIYFEIKKDRSNEINTFDINNHYDDTKANSQNIIKDEIDFDEFAFPDFLKDA